MRLSLRATKNWASTPRKPSKPKPQMTKAEFRSLCAQLMINDNETAAELLGPGWRMCQRYWYGEVLPPPSTARLLRLAVQCKLTHEQLRRAAFPKGHST
jgi:hypothetical protein